MLIPQCFSCRVTDLLSSLAQEYLDAPKELFNGAYMKEGRKALLEAEAQRALGGHRTAAAAAIAQQAKEAEAAKREKEEALEADQEVTSKQEASGYFSGRVVKKKNVDLYTQARRDDMDGDFTCSNDLKKKMALAGGMLGPRPGGKAKSGLGLYADA